MESMVSDIKTALAEANDKHNRQLITIGTGIILSLIGAIITLLVALNKIN
jgi:glucose uptake protein GlcU